METGTNTQICEQGLCAPCGELDVPVLLQATERAHYRDQWIMPADIVREDCGSLPLKRARKMAHWEGAERKFRMDIKCM